MRVNELIELMEQIAPLAGAASWDEPGLHVGDFEQTVHRAMLCIDLTEAVLAEACEKRCELVVAYHPPIFKPLRRLTTSSARSRAILEAARRGVSVYSPHTALDAAPDGLNDWLAWCAAGGAERARSIEAIPAGEPKPHPDCKLVVFVPPSDLEAVRDAVVEAGAGWIGGYSRCSYMLSGQGTFLGHERTHPTVGRQGRLEQVDEIRLEMVCPSDRVGPAVDAVRRSHSYEEPAFDVYPLLRAPARGAARRVTLDRALTVKGLADRLKKALGIDSMKIASPAPDTRVQTIGLCAGAGYSLLHNEPCDAIFTGEMRHHDTLQAVGEGRAVLLAGHTQTERPFLPIYRDRLATQTGDAIEWAVSVQDRSAMRVV